MSKPKISPWQWPNILALDAALIAVAWQAVIAHTHNASIGIPEKVVLGLSVWLTYLADRLFDVRNRSKPELLAARHQFAKHNAKRLWIIWWFALIVNVSFAATGLSCAQLMGGLILLCCCLTYTGLNQGLSTRFFPKELCVATIFAGGVLIFIPSAYNWLILVHLSSLYLLNCLQISKNELTVDAALRVHSLASTGSRLIWAIIGVFLGSAIALAGSQQTNLALVSSSSGLSLAALHLFRRHISLEHFRVLSDLTLFIGPTVYATMVLFQ